VQSTIAPPNMRSQVTQFTDQDPGWGASVPSVMDSTRDVAYSDNTSLGEFLRRPISIWRQTWLSTDTATTVWAFDPWYLFLSNPQIANKIDTYKLLQGSLRVKFVINANGFSYGCMMAYYHPLQYQDTTAGYNAVTNVDPDASGIVSAHGTFSMRKQHLIRHSQKPRVFLMPQTSTGGTLELPFLWPQNWLDLTAGDADKMGKIFLCQLNPLKSLTLTNTARVSINAYAWMEDAKLSLTTTFGHKLYNVPSSGSGTAYKISYSWPPLVPAYKTIGTGLKTIADSHAGADEYGTGPVSKVANSVALAAGSLSEAPIIGPYARASSLIAGGIGRLASLFGYSRPTIITDVTPYKPIYFGNLANTDAGDSSQKLTLDSKQEVSIDPRVVGLPPKDEMTIRSIAGRESFFATFEWSGASGAGGQAFKAGKRLMNCLVTPLLYQCYVPTSPVNHNKIEYNMTGCCFAALPFGAWRGTMRYRFQIIASQFHRGRIRVVWDPRKIKEQGTHSLWETSNIMSCIIDLAENRDFTVDIGWGQSTTYMIAGLDPGNRHVDEASYYLAGSTAANTSIKEEWGNGTIGIYVVNELVATATGTGAALDTPSAWINMFVSCPDLDVANPEEAALQRWMNVIPEGLGIPPDLAIADSHAGFSETEPEHKPVSPGAADFYLGPSVPMIDDKTSSVYYGDPIVSLRTLMKRYCFHMGLVAFHDTTDASTQSNVIIYTLPDYPQPYGTAMHLWAPLYVSTNPNATNRKEYGWCPAKNSWLSFYSPAYACRRGGIRWKYMYKAEDKASTSDNKYLGLPATFLVTRGTWPKPEFSRRRAIVAAGRYEKMPLDFQDDYPSGEGGLFATNTQGNPVIEVELPFYCYYRFLSTKQQDYIPSAGVKYTRESEARNLLPTHSVTCNLSGNKNNAEPILSYVAAADDYSLFMYLGPPVLYHLDNKADVESKTVARLPYEWL